MMASLEFWSCESDAQTEAEPSLLVIISDQQRAQWCYLSIRDHAQKTFCARLKRFTVNKNKTSPCWHTHIPKIHFLSKICYVALVISCSPAPLTFTCSFLCIDVCIRLCHNLWLQQLPVVYCWRRPDVVPVWTDALVVTRPVKRPPALLQLVTE